MATITLVQAARHDAANIHTMTAQPMGVVIVGLNGGPVQFTCTNPLETIRGAASVDIAYNAPISPIHETVQVSSVIP